MDIEPLCHFDIQQMQTPRTANNGRPPIQIHVDPKAKPVCFTKPAPVPLHWQEQVEKDLL